MTMFEVCEESIETMCLLEVLNQFLSRSFCSGLKELLFHLEGSLRKSS